MNNASFRVRAWILILLLLGIVGAYLMRLIDMQVVHGEAHAEEARNGSVKKQTVQAARGEIIDRYGRPLVVNQVCFDIIFEKAYMERGTENAILLQLFELFEEEGETWNDNLPISKTEPFSFVEGMDNAVSRLKNHLKVQPYARIDDVFLHLVERYDLEEYDPVTQRKLAGVRYEMEQRGYSITIPYTFAGNVSRNIVSRISERNYDFPGVREIESTVRNYVSGDIAPWIIGRVGSIYKEEYEAYKEQGYEMNDIVGKDGIERAFEEELRGKNGTTLIYMNNGSVVDVVEETKPQPGKTLSLTIDKDLQKKLQEVLEAHNQNLNATAQPLKGKEAEGASAVILQVKTGEILAAANYPGYNLMTFQEDYAELVSDPLSPMFNRAFQGEYTPGSIFKPGMSVAALGEGIITPESTVNCTGIYTYYQDYQPGCTGYHGEINVFNAIKYSCNILFYDVGRRLGIESIDKYATLFGFGEPTGVELYEKTGQMSSPELSASLGVRWEQGDVLQTSIGQSKTTATPLQLANYVATIANKGKRMRPHLVKSINDYNFDYVIEETSPEVLSEIPVSEEIFQVVTEGMIRMASYWFADYPIPVATKTGTPQAYGPYTNSTFITFAPADDPEIAMAIVVEKGGGTVCAPIAKEIYDFYFGFDQAEEEEKKENLLLS